MAHKIKVRAVPHVNADGNLSETKKDYIVRCKSRGKLCTHEKFTSKSDAKYAVDQHWSMVHNRRVLNRVVSKKDPRTLNGRLAVAQEMLGGNI